MVLVERLFHFLYGGYGDVHALEAAREWIRTRRSSPFAHVYLEEPPVSVTVPKWWVTRADSSGSCCAHWSPDVNDPKG
jgi:hypothetical protein